MDWPHQPKRERCGANAGSPALLPHLADTLVFRKRKKRIKEKFQKPGGLFRGENWIQARSPPASAHRPMNQGLLESARECACANSAPRGTARESRNVALSATNAATYPSLLWRPIASPAAASTSSLVKKKNWRRFNAARCAKAAKIPLIDADVTCCASNNCSVSVPRSISTRPI